MGSTTTLYRREIDGLRAIAVASVILNHFDNSILPSGYLGVDIFFVISGYVISLSLLSRDCCSLRDFLLGFYARRFKRLLPALVVCVAATAVAISLFSLDPAQSLKTGICSLFGLSNLYLFHVSNDYFGSPSQLNAFTHTWSLGVEEQFYLVFPVILWALLQGPAANRARGITIVVTALAVVSLTAFAYMWTSQPMAAFYLMPLRFWELAVGCLVATYHYQRGRQTPFKRQGAGNSAPVLILVVLCFPPQGALSAVAVVTLSAAAVATLSSPSLAYKALTSGPATYVGLRSYSLYLWHWPVLVLSRFTIGVHWWSVPILSGIILLVGHLSYEQIEKPLRSRTWGHSDSFTVLWGVWATTVVAVFVAILVNTLYGQLYAGTPAKLAARNVESLSDAYQIPRTSYSWAGAKCVLSTYGEAGKDIPLDACTLGSFDRSTRRVMVLGNSFAAAFVHGFDELVKNDHYAVTITSSYGGSPVGGMLNETPWSQDNAYYWRDVVPHMISRLRRGDWVVLVSDLADLAPPNTTQKDRLALASYKKGLLRLSAQLARTGVHLGVLDANPFIKETYCKPETALPQWFAPAGGPCAYLTRADTIQRRRTLHDMLLKLQHDHQLVVIDLIDIFCPGKTCTFLGANGEVLYRDDFAHPSVEAVREAAPVFQDILSADK